MERFGAHGSGGDLARSRWLDASRVRVLLALYVGAYVLWQVAAPGSEATRGLVANLVFVPIGVAGSLFALRTARHPSVEPRARRAWLLLTAAFTCFLLGDLLWIVNENILGIEPFPSIADAFYLPFYPLVLWGFLSFPSDLRQRGDRLKFWLDAGTVLLAGWMLVWYFVIGPIALDHGAPPVQTILSIAYPVGDLLVLFGITAVILRRPASASRRSLFVLAAGALLFVVADTAFSYLDFNELYRSGQWPDTLWMLAQASFAYSAVVQVEGVRRGEVERSSQEMSPSAVSRLPYIAVAAGYAMLLVAARNQSIYPVGGLLAAAVGVTGLVLARQLMVLRENARLLARLHELATTDGLTGLRTRRAFHEQAEREFELAVRYGRPLSAIMLDVDHFKQVNDAYGHEIGDAVLVAVSDECRNQLRAGDVIGRQGGDEIVLLLPGSGIHDAEAVGERICRAIEARPVRVGDHLVPVTISLGVAGARGRGSFGELLRNADEALYVAKAAGRNQLHTATSA